ncbi:unnamed protein product [Macrosiphum euphorbiae]|uniref:Uncharacterized protein n=1 Tax=Macrosiphum euphorbiae TaxID=13131 RepID=A0AAV0W6I7_9HEMI|nr:unnamed protein product [Macrosiphum euphorbiae]
MNAIRLCFTATVAFLVVAIGGRVASSMNNTVRVRKCCPVDHMYDPDVHFCRPAEEVSEQWLMNRLRSRFRVAADETLEISYDGESFCHKKEVLVDVPTEEVRGLMEAHPSTIELPSVFYCIDLSLMSKLVARTCRPRDQYCGRGNYTCVRKCCDNRDIIVDVPNS